MWSKDDLHGDGFSVERNVEGRVRLSERRKSRKQENSCDASAEERYATEAKPAL